jgi:hypothetical protein
MKKALLVTVLLATATYAGWRWVGGSSGDATDGNQLALDRIWLDHIPVNDRDTVQVFAALTEEPVGIFQAASQWRGAYELFRYQGRGDKLDVVFPQTRERENVQTRATRCNDSGMDYCLELSGTSRGVKRYYSRKGWEIGGAKTADDIAHRVDAIVDAAGK